MKTVIIKNLISAGKASIDAYTTGVRIDHNKLSDALIGLKKEIEEAEKELSQSEPVKEKTAELEIFKTSDINLFGDDKYVRLTDVETFTSQQVNSTLTKCVEDIEKAHEMFEFDKMIAIKTLKSKMK